MKLGRTSPGESGQTDVAHECADNDEGVGQDDGRPAGDPAPEEDQDQAGGLQAEISHPKAQAIKPIPVLAPQRRDDEGAEDVQDGAGQDDRADVDELRHWV